MGLFDWLLVKKNLPSHTTPGRTSPRSSPGPSGVRNFGNPATTNQEPLLALLAQIEAELKISKLLPVRRLYLNELFGEPSVAWSYSRSGKALDVDAAEDLLKPRFQAIGLRLGSCGGYTSDDDGMSNMVFWDYSAATTAGSGFEDEVERLNKMSRDAALKEGAQLIANGKFGIMIAWLCQGQYYGIPGELLANCGIQEAANRIVPLLDHESHDIRTRASTALGPLGGQEAAQKLCRNLANATRASEFWRIAKALAKIGWPGAVGALIDVSNKSNDPSVRASLAKAVVHCGDKEKGLNILYKGLMDDKGSNDYVSALSELDKEGLADARFVPEMLSLLERTKNTAISIAREAVLKRHRDEWEAISRARAITPYRVTPSKKGRPLTGKVFHSLADASALTGISIEEIQKLAKERRVRSGYIGGELRVELDYDHPCGDIIDDPDPLQRSIGAKQD